MAIENAEQGLESFSGFALVINALLFWGVSELAPGFRVGGFWGALWGALVYSLLTWLVNLALSDKKPVSIQFR